MPHLRAKRNFPAKMRENWALRAKLDQEREEFEKARLEDARAELEQARAVARRASRSSGLTFSSTINGSPG